MRIQFTIVLACLIMLACKQSATIKEEQDETLVPRKPNSGLSYAEGFTIEVTDQYNFLTVLNPWNQDTLATYLVQKTKSLPNDFPHADFIIQLPVKTIACLSSPGIGMLCYLNSSHLISAATDPEHIYDSIVYHRFLNDKIVNLGKSTNLNTEVIVNHNPDLIIKHIYGGKELADSRLKDAGIPIVYHLEFMEVHPLGRAEWIKFFAAFLDKSALADSIFGQIENTYLQYSSLAKNM